MRTPGDAGGRGPGEGEDLPPAWSYAVCYGLYALILALCYASFWIWRATAEVVVGYLYRREDSLNAIYLASTLTIGLILFTLAVASEPYLRGGLERVRAYGRPQGHLRRAGERFARLAVPLAGGMVVALLLQEWALTSALTAASRPPASPVAGALPPGSPPVVATGPPAPAPSTQAREGGAPGPWIAGAGLAIAGTVLLALWKRPG